MRECEGCPFCRSVPGQKQEKRIERARESGAGGGGGACLIALSHLSVFIELRFPVLWSLVLVLSTGG